MSCMNIISLNSIRAYASSPIHKKVIVSIVEDWLSMNKSYIIVQSIMLSTATTKILNSFFMIDQTMITIHLHR